MLFLCAATTLPAQTTPLIDREIFFGNPEVAGAQLSPDGKYMTFLKANMGTLNIWIKKAGESFDQAVPLTADTTRPITGYFWSRDSRYVLYVQDKGGDENYHIYAVDPAKAVSGVPEARNLTPREKTRALIFAVPEKRADILFVGLNDRDPAWHDLYELNIHSGELKLLRENTERITGWVFDLNDQIRLATRSAEDGSTEVLRVDPSGFQKVYECGPLETCGPVRFHKDGARVYMVTNKGDNVDLVGLILFNPQTLQEEFVESDPLKRVDLGGPLFSEVSQELIGTRYADDKIRVYWRNKQFAKDYKFLQKKLSGKEVTFGSNTADEVLWLVTASSDTDPGAVYLFDRKNKTLTFQYRPRPKIPVEHLASMKPIRYPSSDGLMIPAYLVVPKGSSGKNLPLIVMPHGGPWARDSWGYNSYAQFLANRGYAVLLPNFRSSTGYGKAFLNAGNRQWGDKMQDDITWGVQYLVKEGIADPKRVGIMGGSYGGYATLAGLAFTPDVYAAGVSIVGPSNLMTLLNSIPAYWESIRKVFYLRMGDPATPEGEAQLKRQSPLFSADKIKAPLLVVQGANDPRVKKAESDQIVVAMRELGRPVEYLVAMDEGHGFAKPDNNMAMLASAEKFLAKHLGGRYQESMTSAVEERLKAMTVDINTVTMPKTADAGTAAAPAPVPETALIAGTYAYKTTLEIAGQKINMDQTLEVTDNGDTWTLTETVSSPMTGSMTDQSTVAKKTLLPLKRQVNQGPVTIQLTYSDTEVKGEMSAGGQKIPVAQTLAGPLFADGAGASALLATLALKEGFETTYRNLDLQTQQIQVIRMKVIGKESVETPAGTFNTYKVEIAPVENEAQKTTVWVTADAARKVVRSVSVLPQMNGAVITAELK